MPKRSLTVAFLLLARLSCAAGGQSPTPPPRTRAVSYTNTQYGIRFLLPATWKGYSVLVETWSGTRTSLVDGTLQEGPSGQEKGPLLRIRHPRWTKAHPHEDIPIMVFTQAQWALVDDERSDVSAGSLITSAAPIPPSELARNATYVFALPPRYNYDYATGWREVENVLTRKPMRTFQPVPQAPSGR